MISSRTQFRMSYLVGTVSGRVLRASALERPSDVLRSRGGSAEGMPQERGISRNGPALRDFGRRHDARCRGGCATRLALAIPGAM